MKTTHDHIKSFTDSLTGAYMGRFGGSTILGGTVDIAKDKAIKLMIDILEDITNQSDDYGESILYGIHDRANAILTDLKTILAKENEKNI